MYAYNGHTKTTQNDQLYEYAATKRNDIAENNSFTLGVIGVEGAYEILCCKATAAQSAFFGRTGTRNMAETTNELRVPDLLFDFNTICGRN